MFHRHEYLMKIQLSVESLPFKTESGYTEKQRELVKKVKAGLEKVTLALRRYRIGLVRLVKTKGSDHPSVDSARKQIKILMGKKRTLDNQLLQIRKAGGYGKNQTSSKRKKIRLDPRTQKALRQMR